MRKLKIILILLINLIAFLSFNFKSKTLNASEINVISELSKDSSFNTGDFPTISDSNHNDYGVVKLITTMETNNKSLVIYTYEPSIDVMPQEIHSVVMWDDYSKNGIDFSPQVYNLKLVSSSSVFAKYVVEDFIVSDEAYRYYNFVSIRVKYDAAIHANREIEYGNINTVAYEVGQQWCFYELNDKLVSEMNTFDTLQIETSDMFVGELAFSNGWTLGSWWNNKYQEGRLHYLAFSCQEYIIKHIYDADLSYDYAPYIYSYNASYSGGIDGDWVNDKKVYLTDEMTGSYVGNGIKGKTIIWDCILSAEDFVNSMESQEVEFVETSKTETLEKQWVFVFAEFESELTYEWFGLSSTVKWERTMKVEDVQPLRIHFQDINNKIYNLGVVSDSVSGDGITDGGYYVDYSEFFQEIIKIIGILVLIVIIAVFFPIIISICSVLFTVLKIVFKILIKIISIPINIISKLFKRKK